MTYDVVRIGVISYGMYLFYLIARHFVGAWLPSSQWWSEPALFALTAVLTIAIAMAEASYRFFESPILTLKNGLKRA